jgi:hypothetical protein
LLLFFFLASGQVFSPDCGLGKDLPEKIRIFEQGQWKAAIVISPGSSGKIRSAAELMARYFDSSTGAAIPVLEKSPGGETVAIHLGPSAYARQQIPSFGSMDRDGFRLEFPDDKNILIIGPTDFGTEFGVLEFLERFLGIRWLLPGPDGEHVPRHAIVDVPTRALRMEPAFFSRFLSGFRGPEQQEWQRRNRLRLRIQFHHNLANLFPPQKYTGIRPEFFPIRDGRRFLPGPDEMHGWQPCFSAEGIVEEAVRNIGEYFDRHPEAASYSLGMNDRGGFCRCGGCSGLSRKGKNFMGYEDHSDLYFRWANAVVQGVLRRHPDKWFGCLAYRELSEPPGRVAVHPRIIPFMSADRLKWADPVLEAEGKGMTLKWKTKSPTLAWSDYIYGTPYLVPRVYFHKMAETYRFAHQNGVRAMYAEAYPNWGEGPKLYLALKLQWDPYQDVDTLLRDWYVAAVGPRAAPDLEAYYGHWEKFWTERAVLSPWFRRAGIYLEFFDPAYLDGVTPADMEKSRRLLLSVLARTETAPQRARASLLLRAFEYYEASVLSYLGMVKGAREGGKGRDHYRLLNQRRYQLVGQFEQDPVLVHPSRFDEKKFKRLQW